MKRLFDIAVAALLLILSIPVLCVVSLSIVLTMGRPILFKQRRPGFKGKPFYIYKFRTMNNARDDNNELLVDKDRLTNTGKILRSFSLDELPQLFNVLRGEISIVGPRPLLMEYLPLYTAKQARRHEVPPGITGWAQINGRNDISWEERFELDVWYVDHRSFLLDLKIIAMTVIRVIKRKDISQLKHVTMSKFEGTHLS